MPETVLELEAVDVTGNAFEDSLEGLLTEDPDVLTPLFLTGTDNPDFKCCCGELCYRAEVE